MDLLRKCFRYHLAEPHGKRLGLAIRIQERQHEHHGLANLDGLMLEHMEQDGYAFVGQYFHSHQHEKPVEVFLLLRIMVTVNHPYGELQLLTLVDSVLKRVRKSLGITQCNENLDDQQDSESKHEPHTDEELLGFNVEE